MMRSLSRWRVAVAGLGAVITVAGVAACSSNSAPGTTTAPSGSSGQPRTGGTLYMLGTGDVDYMDPNISYYTVGYEDLRMWEQPLMAYPAIAGKTTTLEPDLAEAAPVVSDNGLEYSFTIRSGVDWDTTPARQVTAADVVRGLERSCNPVKPSGALPDYQALIVGFNTFCLNFEKVKPTISAIDTYMNTHSVAGAYVDPSNPLTVIFKLVHPATYFPALTTLGPFMAVPKEIMNYLPVSTAQAEHTISDGPYQIVSYVPGKSIVYDRNPVWKAALDPISKAYVNKIVVNETASPQTVQEELQANSPTADLYWGDTEVPTPDVPGLEASHNPGLVLGPTDGLDPFMIFNFADPNDGGAMKDLAVRQAISYAIDRSALTQDAGGPQLAPAQTQVLPSNALGYSNFNDYPYNQAKAKQLLGGKKLTLKLLYQVGSPVQSKIFQTIQYDLSQVGITVTGVGVPTADIYTKYLFVPSEAKTGVWDLALDQWYPDWYGNNAVNYFYPIFDGLSEAPAGANMGLYNNTTVNNLIAAGGSATSPTVAASDWAAADKAIMAQAVAYPIDTVNWATYVPTDVHNAVFVPYIQAIDPTNVWLSS
jgi:peptide/nickel transport system substrate-binding protein